MPIDAEFAVELADNHINGIVRACTEKCPEDSDAARAMMLTTVVLIASNLMALTVKEEFENQFLGRMIHQIKRTLPAAQERFQELRADLIASQGKVH